MSEPRRTKFTFSCCRLWKLTGQSILTDAETDKMCRVLYLHNPSLKKIETLDLLYGQYNELTLWISARPIRIICLVTNGLIPTRILKMLYGSHIIATFIWVIDFLYRKKTVTTFLKSNAVYGRRHLKLFTNCYVSWDTL